MTEANDAIDRDADMSLFADISFGVGVAAIAAGVVLWAVSGDSDADAIGHAYIAPLPDGGGAVGMAGRF